MPSDRTASVRADAQRIARGPVEGREKAVAEGFHLPFLEIGELPARGGMVGIRETAPSLVAELFGACRRAHNICKEAPSLGRDPLRQMPVRRSALVNAVDLKDVLGAIKTNCRNVQWGGSLSGAQEITLPHGTPSGRGRRPPHHL